MCFVVNFIIFHEGHYTFTTSEIVFVKLCCGHHKFRGTYLYKTKVKLPAHLTNSDDVRFTFKHGWIVVPIINRYQGGVENLEKILFLMDSASHYLYN